MASLEEKKIARRIRELAKFVNKQDLEVLQKQASQARTRSRATGRRVKVGRSR